jgi:hypothetical protein
MSSCPLSAASLAKAQNAKLRESKFKLELEKVKVEEPAEEEENNGLVEEEDEGYVPQVRRKRRAPETIAHLANSNVRSDVHDSVFRPGYAPSVKNIPVTKATHAKLVNWDSVEEKFDTSLESVKKWSPEQVRSFAQQVLGLNDKGNSFVDEVKHLSLFL